MAADENTQGDIYRRLADHQRAEEWAGRVIVGLLQEWANRFIVEFELDIPEVVLCVEKMPTSTFGHFRWGHNGFGLKGEIALNARHIHGPERLWETLGVLLKQLLHAWQQTRGLPAKGAHINVEFRQKAAQLGLLVSKQGLLGFAADSPFKALLRRNGIAAPETEQPIPTARPRGSSKQKKWCCDCVNVRCAVRDFYAQCLRCGQVFQRSE